MAVFLQPIYTQTVGAGGAASIQFNNIPQTFTDLKLVLSLRTSASAVFDYIGINTNNGSAADIIRLQGTGSVANSNRGAGGSSFIINGNTATSNTFSSTELYIPNYTSSTAKQIIIDTVTENNGTTAYQELNALYYALGGNPINTILFSGSSSLLQYSTFSLYGILRSGV